MIHSIQDPGVEGARPVWATKTRSNATTILILTS